MLGGLASAAVETDAPVFRRLASGLKKSVSAKALFRQKKKSEHTKHLQSLPTSLYVLVTSAHSYSMLDSNLFETVELKLRRAQKRL